MATAAARDLLLPRPPAGMGAGALLALLVHAGLIVALAFSVRWRSSVPAGIEAELWAAVPQLAAPAPAPAPAPAVERAEPKPVPQPEPRAEPRPEPPPDPQIAIERDKRERAQRERELQEQAAKAAREKAETARREEQALVAQREENLRRMQTLAGGAQPSTGNASQTAGPSASYAGRIKARIKPNVVFTDTVDGNPLATVEVRTAGDGTIVGRRLVKSSGVKSWDDAVLRAIDKTEILPRDTDGRVPPTIVIDFTVRE